jgi:hypothetical protein
MADGKTVEQTGLIQVFRSLDLDRKITISAEHTIPPTLSITKNHLTTPIGIALSSDGIAYDNGTTISNTTWTTLQDKITSISAVAPNGGNGALLVVNKEVAIQNADTSPTRVIDTMAGDPTVVGEHFGIEWVGNTKPFIMATLDSTDLQIKDTTLNLLSADASTNLLPSGIFHTGTTTGDDFTISTNQDLTITADNIDLSSTGRLIIPTLSSADYFDYNSGKLTLVNSNAGGALNPQVILTNTNGTGSVAMEIYKNKPTVGVVGDPLFTQSVFGKDATLPNGNKQEYTRITHTIRDPTAGSEEGSIEMGCFVGGTYQNLIQLNGVDAPSGEVNILRPLDLTTGSTGLIKVSGSTSTDMTLDATLSQGTGNININPKLPTGVINLNGDVDMNNSELLIIRDASNNNRIEIEENQIDMFSTNGGDSAILQINNNVPLGTNSIVQRYTEDLVAGDIQTASLCIPTQQYIELNDTRPTRNQNIKLDNGFSSTTNRISMYKSDNVNLEGTTAITTTYNDQALNFTSSNSTTSTSKSLVLENSVGGGKLAYINNAGDTTGLTIDSANNNLLLQSTSVISGQGNIEFAPSQSANGQIVFTGASLQSTTAGGNSGEYLIIVLNGNTYKIKLEDP